MSHPPRQRPVFPLSAASRLISVLACALLLAGHAEADPPPTITSFSPTHGMTGTVVTIYGTDFEPTEYVSLYGNAFSFSVKPINSTEIVLTIPGDPITGPITISGSNGTVGTPTDFIITGHPPINEVPLITVVASIPRVTVGSGQYGEFTLGMPMTSSKDLSIHYTLTGSALNGIDYRQRTGVVKIKALAPNKTIKIIPQGDLGGASKKTVKLTLMPGDGYLVATTAPSKVRIVAGQ